MMLASQNQSAEAKNALTVLRAVALSRKHPATLRQLADDYKQLEGQNIDYQKFGYKRLQDFIIQSGEFIVQTMQGEMYFTAKPTAESNHIRKMIASQKTSKKFKGPPRLRQPILSDRNWNKSSYSSNVYNKLPSPRKLPRVQHRRIDVLHNKRDDRNNNNNNQSNRNILMNQNQSNDNVKMLQLHLHQEMKQSSFRTNLQDRLKQFQQQQPQISKINQTTDVNLQQKTVPKNDNLIQVQNSVKTENDQQQKQFLDNTQQKQNSQVSNNMDDDFHLNKSFQITSESESSRRKVVEKIFVQNLQERLQISNVKFEPETFSNKSNISLQNRLNIVQTIHNTPSSSLEKQQNENTSQSSVSVIKNNQIKTSSNAIFNFDSNADPILLLKEYCEFKKYEQPVYKIAQQPFDLKYIGRILINGTTYSTYPESFAVAEKAKSRAAQKAVDELKYRSIREKYQICTDSDTEIVLKIYDEVKKHPNGVFHKNIIDLFEVTYEKLLPDNWFSLLQDSNMFTLEKSEILGDNFIIYAKEEIESSSASTASDTDEVDSLITHLSLPWHQKHWNLYITFCTSTTEIYGRILDARYNDKLNDLLNDIEIDMLTNKQRPASIICGQIYLVSISDCWSRAQVQEMNKETGKCLCFFIDFGDEEWCNMEELYVCESKYLTLPPQAICFSLFGLEDFAENPNAKKHLDTLNGHSFVGEILTKHESYEEKYDVTTRIQIVLYDTSTKEDINMNSELLEKISKDTLPPKLKNTGVNQVIITHINDSGELYLQLQSLETQYVQKLIQQIVESKFKEEQYRVCRNDLKLNNLYFIQDLDDNRWYRGVLTKEIQINNEKELFEIFYVDHGRIKMISISQIFRLDSLSLALSKFPRQAIKTQLYNLPPVNEKIIGLIRGLLPPNTSVIVKVAVNAVIPQVTVHRRFDDNGILVNINDSIQTEYELDNSSCIEAVTNNSSPTPMKTNSFLNTTATASEITPPLSPTNGSGVSGLRALRATPTPPIPSNILQQQQKNLPKLKFNLPPVNDYFDVVVVMASHPGNFIVQSLQNGKRLLEMMRELQEYCKSNEEFIPMDMIEVGQAYAAFNRDSYYRIVVENITNAGICARCCDYGGVSIYSNDKLKTLPAKFRVLPMQAFRARLTGIKPISGDWEINEILRFQELTAGKKFQSIVKLIQNDILELDLIDVSTEKDINIREKFLEENRAIEA